MATNWNNWDMPGMNFRTGVTSNGINTNFRRVVPHGSGPILSTPFGGVPSAPPLPPRPSYNNYMNPYNSHSSYYNNYGIGDYSGYGGYGYGYRSGLNSFGYGFGQNKIYGINNPESRFVQLAEESSRPAFQSIQSILQAFSSVAMMFESTFHAIHSSYMSVIGVADNFGKLRSVFGQVFSALAIFRTFNWIYRKLLYLLGISKHHPESEAVWEKALSKTYGFPSNEKGKAQRPGWSVMLFLSIIMGGPYLVFKLMNHIYPNPVQDEWVPSQNPGSLAVGMYDFHTSNDQELGFSANQKLMIAPERFQPLNCQGWLLACNENRKIGLVPNNYIGMIMHSEKTGKTYVEHNGQNYPSAINNIEDSNAKETGYTVGKLSAKVEPMTFEEECTASDGSQNV